MNRSAITAGTVLRPDPDAVGLSLPLATASVHAGFPSPAEDHAEQRLDLAKRLIRRPSATFFVKAEGDSMLPLIRTGDLLIVDRSRTPKDRDVVIAIIGGCFAVRRYCAKASVKSGVIGTRSFVLLSDNRPHAATEDDDEVEVWGVVTSIIRELIRA
jgi:DNA polymerase V